MRQHGPWQIVRSQVVYKDSWLEVRKDDVIRPDGRITHGPSCTLILKAARYLDRLR